MNDNLPTADQIILDVMRHCGFRRNYQVAAYFNVTPQTLSGWIKSGVIPPRHLVKYNNEILKANSKENTPALQMDKSNPSYQGNDNVSPQRFSLATVKFTFVKHLRTLIMIPILSIFCALVYLFIIAEPVYTSVSKILPISEDGTNANGLTGMAAEFGISIPLSMGGKIPWDEIYPEIVQSERLLSSALNNQFMSKKYGNRILLDIIVAEYDLMKYKESERSIRAIAELKKRIIITKDRLSPVVTLSIEAFEAQFAADLSRYIIDKSGQIQRQLKTNRVRQKRLFIEERMTEVSNELDQKEKILREFRENNRNLSSPALQMKVQEMGREVDLQSSLYLTLRSQFEKAKIEEVDKDDMVQLIDGPTRPIKLTRPRRRLGIPMAILFGVFLAVFIIYFKEHLLVTGKDEEITSQKANKEFSRKISRLSFRHRK